ncbi:hypothetical protein F4778DRAFT_54314 [Xylariomycetidae sp. FL2044]|nr:hypothetical protein F4778DRAFT_54314 [Xylariomycetidae sp. FL2044]
MEHHTLSRPRTHAHGSSQSHTTEPPSLRERLTQGPKEERTSKWKQCLGIQPAPQRSVSHRIVHPHRVENAPSHEPSSRRGENDRRRPKIIGTTSQKPTPEHHSGAIQRPSPNHSGTRGLFIPAYKPPHPFVQRHRNHPCPPLPISPEDRPSRNRARDRDNSAAVVVVVRLYNCENFVYSKAVMHSPRLDDVISAAVAFLGECHLRLSSSSDTAAARATTDGHQNQKQRRRIPGYVGLNLEEAHGGFHLHYPDCAGVIAFHRNQHADWESVLKHHAMFYPGHVLLVGVGLGDAGHECVSG